jgi:hypothetical protein
MSDTQHNDTQHKGQFDESRVFIIILSVAPEFHNDFKQKNEFTFQE